MNNKPLQKMSTDELRDWIAYCIGWRRNILGGWDSPDDSSKDQLLHPIPDTLEGIHLSLPPGWSWDKYLDDAAYSASTKYGTPISVLDTGDEIYDRFLLSALAWEKEGKKIPKMRKKIPTIRIIVVSLFIIVGYICGKISQHRSFNEGVRAHAEGRYIIVEKSDGTKEVVKNHE